MNRHTVTLTVLAALLALLTLASSASAECAWVLWSSAVLPATGETAWGVISAYSLASGGEDACVRVASKWNKEAQTDERKKRLSVDYTCLPDTVDPRGPRPK